MQNSVVLLLSAEILRRFRYLEPESREQMSEKLNDLLVYAEVAKGLRSELIAIIVLSKLRKWENLLLHPEKGKISFTIFVNLTLQLISFCEEMPPLPSPSPEQIRRLQERKRTIQERDHRTANTLRQYEEHGDERRSNLQTIDPFASNIRTIKLPPQTIGPPQPRLSSP